MLRKLSGPAILIAAALLVGSCAGVPREAVPPELADTTTALSSDILVRTWGDVKPKNLNALAKERYDQLKAARPAMTRPGARPVVNFLAISGGGADGAFAAGLLSGWSASGKRPQFELVTGVSTGALAAPFAFLGSQYDPQLREMYTTYSTRDFVRKQPVRGLLGGASLADSAPLERLIERYADQALIDAVSAEHRKGRRLLVGTTNIDAQRPVIWDLGKIAASGHPQSAALFRKVLLASASIPGAFPPVRIAVNAGGKVLQEQHVDGGTTKQVFLLPGQLMLKTAVDRRYQVNPRRRLYIIRNGRIGPEYKVVEANTLSIAQRSISTLIKNQGIGDLYQLNTMTRRNGISFNLAYIPVSFPDTSTEIFDPKYMQALFDLGFEKGKAGYKWAKAPPGLGR